MTGLDLLADNWLIKNNYSIRLLLEEEEQGVKAALMEAFKAGYQAQEQHIDDINEMVNDIVADEMSERFRLL